ncbi:MAG: hypothetical protein PHN48_00090 [Parabacteroides sp.]|nr:hypothetical protein [Parabacteroides sp.]
MYAVSEQFKKAIQDNTRKFYWTGKIKTKGKKEYSFTNEDIVKGSGYISNQCCGSTEIEIGSVYAAELGITLYTDIDRYTMEGAEITLSFWLELADGSYEEVPMGIFEVSEANRTINCLELKAYDYMLRFEEAFGNAITTGTPYQILTLASKACKVELAQTQAELEALPNGKEVFGVYSDNDIETWRDLIFYLAQSLACFATINREGKLELRQYGITSVMDISNKQRFSSSFSDFKTRYTAVNSTNVRTQIAEYYALDPDDGLTMNLGISPLLQYGLEETRKRVLETILAAISTICYVPFNSTTIGNPALDVGDIITCSGGHADEKAFSCITGLNYKINGKHTIKCVGTNPRLAQAKSKNDKNITGLLNQVEAGKIIYYNFVNAAPFLIRSTPQEVLSIDYVSAEETSATFLAEILLETTGNEKEEAIVATDEDGNVVNLTTDARENVVLKVTYKHDLEEETTFYPLETYQDGKHCLTLFYPISTVASNTGQRFTVLLSAEGGHASIDIGQIRATISGQGLVSGLSGWDGRIELTDFVDRVDMQTGFNYTVERFLEAVDCRTSDVPGSIIRENLGRIRYDAQAFVVFALNENLTDTIIIKTFTLDTNNPGEYDPTVVLIVGDAFVLKSDYNYEGQDETINYGLMKKLSIETERFSRIDSLEVSFC